MKHVRHIAFIVSIVLVGVALDQATKYWAVTSLQHEPPKEYLGNLFRIVYASNTGSFLGLGASLPKAVRFWLFSVFTGAVVVGILTYIIRHRHLSRWELFSFSLLVTGGIGNLIDRLFRGGSVIDFMNMGIGGLRTGIFNVADLAIMVGIFMLLTMRLFVSVPTTGDLNAEEDA